MNTMKMFGDITDKDRAASKELQEMETVLTSNKRKLPKSRIAKGYVCLVYDWYRIGMEEEGNRLLQKIDEVCPDYFYKHFAKHVEDDKNYEQIVQKLFIEFAFLLTNRPESFVIKSNS